MRVGDFEEMELPGGSADSLFSATAYHWISSAAQTDRPAYLLRSGGVVAIVDLIQATSAVDHGFFEAAQPIYARRLEQPMESYGRLHGATGTMKSL